MKILIISDIHGNLEALQSVLAESRDELWALGDLVNYGPNPSEVVDLIRESASLVVQGNHDNALGTGADPKCSPGFRELAQAMQAYTDSALRDEQKAYLSHLPVTAQREVDGKRFFLCHATPSEPLYMYGSGEPAFWAREAASVNADFLLVGHTHLPFILDLGTQRVVNPGSVGQPKHGRCEACYAVWEEDQITLRSQQYDVASTVARMLGLPIEERIRRRLVDVLESGSPSERRYRER